MRKSGFITHPQPDGMGLVLDNVVDIEWNEVQRSLRETSAAGLVPRQVFFLQQEDRPPGHGQFIGQKASGGSGADNSDIVEGLITFGQYQVSMASVVARCLGLGRTK